MSSYNFLCRSLYFIALATGAMLSTACEETEKDPEIPVESIELNKVSIYAFTGDQIQLNATILPVNATDTHIEWSSSDENIAFVDSTGLVKIQHNEGTASIYATCGAAYAQCDVTSVFAEIGQYYCSDGTISDEYDPEKAVALIFYTRHHPNDLSDYSSTGIGNEKCHGYAVALHDAIDSWCVWGPYEILECYPKDQNGNPIDNFAGNTSDTDWSGYLYTQIIQEAAQKLDGMWGPEKLEGYAACWYAVNYENTVPAPATSSGWFLPAGSQLWSIYENIDLLYREDAHQFVEDDWYWSSSEYFGNPERGANFLNLQSGRIEGLDKTGGNLVRSILAF